MTMELIHGDCLDFLYTLKPSDHGAIFMDPPDNIGYGYADDESGDKRSPEEYYLWLRTLLLESMRVVPVVWLSYHWSHDVELKYHLRSILKGWKPSWEYRLFWWRFTFSNYTTTDCQVGFRPMIRLSRSGFKWSTDEIRIQSERQRIGDSRADPSGRVPDSVWDYPRIVGNAGERRIWHPTQHPEAMVKRMMLMTNSWPWYDLFLGSGTSFRAGRDLKGPIFGIERSSTYCKELSFEHGVKIQESGVKI